MGGKNQMKKITFLYCLLKNISWYPLVIMIWCILTYCDLGKNEKEKYVSFLNQTEKEKFRIKEDGILWIKRYTCVEDNGQIAGNCDINSVEIFNKKGEKIKEVEFDIIRGQVEKITTNKFESGKKIESVINSPLGYPGLRDSKFQSTYNEIGDRIKHSYYVGDNQVFTNTCKITYNEQKKPVKKEYYTSDGNLLYYTTLDYNNENRITTKRTEAPDGGTVVPNRLNSWTGFVA